MKTGVEFTYNLCEKMVAKGSEFSIEERRKIEFLLKTNKTIMQIAQELTRSRSGIGKEIAKNGGVRIYNANLAQERCENIKQIKYQKSQMHSKAQQKQIIDILDGVIDLRIQMALLLQRLNEFGVKIK